MVSADIDARHLMSESKFYEGYSRWDEEKGRYETWEEAVERVMNMHRTYYADKMTPELEGLITKAEIAYKDKRVLGAQRALQFGGEQILSHHMRLYNCTSSYADRAAFFGEIFYILLCGAGAGFSVQKHHVAKLPKVQNRTKQAKIHVVEDSIEGWATAADVLLSSYFVGGGKHPEYEGRRVYFDLSKIRPKGAFISGGFKAPGPEPLRRALDKIEHLIQGIILRGEDRLRPIHVYDIVMFEADAVLSGGVRRSATICLFSPDDEEMMKAKTGNWFIDNPQRGRSNNSAVIVRKLATREMFAKAMKNVREFGEPGFVFVESTEHCFNPCVEIGMFPQIDGKTGFQGCNLSEINGAKCDSEEEFLYACEVASIIGTLQAGYTDFKFVSEETRRIFEREALIGCSVTGWMNNPDVLLNEEAMRKGAKKVMAVNKYVAKLIGINPAARGTCCKPAGNASVLLETASGVHDEPAPRYIRHVQMNKESEVAKLLREVNPYMVEESVWSAGKTDYAIAFPVIPKKGSRFKKDTGGLDFLEMVKKIQQNWIEYGTDESLCADPTVRHNVSNTVYVKRDQWDAVEQYLFDNRQFFAGVSLLGETGDRDFHQAPNTEVLSETEIVEKYGPAAMFASGLIVDASRGFDNLWEAISVATPNEDNGESATKEVSDLRADWIRRFRKFAETHFEGDYKKTGYCLKDVAILYKWSKIQNNYTEVDFITGLSEKKFTDIDTLGAAACAGGGCEI